MNKKMIREILILFGIFAISLGFTFACSHFNKSKTPTEDELFPLPAK